MRAGDGLGARSGGGDLVDVEAGGVGGKNRITLVDELLREAAAFNGIGIIFLDIGEAALERFLIGFLEEHRNSRVSENHGNAAAHGASANDAHGVHAKGWRLFRYVGNLRDFALSEECMNERLRLIGEEAFCEKLFFFLATLVKR